MKVTTVAASAFALAAALMLNCRGASAALLINELDSDSVNEPNPPTGLGTDPKEFIELYETTGTSVPLDGLVLVFLNGNGNVVYRAIDLDGFSTDSNGYFVAGNATVPNIDVTFPTNTLQNGGDGIGLYTGNAADYPNGQAASAANLIDAVVYRTGGDVDGATLATLLLLAGPVVDEFGRDGLAATGAVDSIGRIPNGSGAARDTTSFTFMTPTPGAANSAPVPEPATAVLAVLGAFATLASRRQRS
jgi:hypothetical protein